VHSLDDARRREVLMGATGKSGQTYIIPVVLNSMLGTKFRVVTGYQGINLIHLAMERGELHGSAASWPTIAAASAASDLGLPMPVISHSTSYSGTSAKPKAKAPAAKPVSFSASRRFSLRNAAKRIIMMPSPPAG